MHTDKLLTRGSTERKHALRRVQAYRPGARQRGCVAFGSGASSMPASKPSAASALFFAPLILTTMALLSVSCAVSDATCSREVPSSYRAFFSSSRREPLSVSSLEISACAPIGHGLVRKWAVCVSISMYLGVWACSRCPGAPS
eukprot:scaffold109167_cov75-Phaeocystis_antarctica.AAC.5